MQLIYIAGSYSAATREGVDANIDRAEATAAGIWRMGAVAVCPHSMTRNPVVADAAPERVFIEGMLELLRVCDATLLVPEDPGQSRSTGTLGEINETRRLGLPLFKTFTEVATWLQTKGPRR